MSILSQTKVDAQCVNGRFYLLDFYRVTYYAICAMHVLWLGVCRNCIETAQQIEMVYGTSHVRHIRLCASHIAFQENCVHSKVKTPPEPCPKLWVFADLLLIRHTTATACSACCQLISIVASLSHWATAFVCNTLPVIRKVVLYGRQLRRIDR